MKLLVYGINYAPELTGIGKYSGEMAEWMAGQGHEVTVITAPPYYPEWKVREGYPRWRWSSGMEAGVRVFRSPLYVPEQPTVLKRILHLLSFSVTSCLPLLRLWRLRPDLIIYVVPTLFCALQILIYARLSGARTVLHVQDYEVDASLGLGMTKAKGLTGIVLWLERAILRRFDKVSTISSGMMTRAVAKGVDPEKVLFFPNWSEIERFRNVRKNHALLASLGLDSQKKVVLYSGNMGEKQGLELVLEAAERFGSRSDIRFLMVGDGGAKSRLQAMAREKQLMNVTFAPLMPYEMLPDLLASADCHLVVQRRGVADAVLPSKLSNILAVGGWSVITAEAGTTLGALCDDYPGIAVRVEPESLEEFVAGIEEVLSKTGTNRTASEYAERNLDKQSILSRFLSEASR